MEGTAMAGKKYIDFQKDDLFCCSIGVARFGRPHGRLGFSVQATFLEKSDHGRCWEHNRHTRLFDAAMPRAGSSSEMNR